MGKKIARDGHSCLDCGFTSPRWFGRCPDCGGWSSTETVSVGTAGEGGPVDLGSAHEDAPRFSTGLPEVDRVTGGGFVRGAVILLAGEPGIGKSTLMLQLLDALRRGSRTSLLVSGEESLAQVALRARRLGIDAEGLPALASTSLHVLLKAAEAGSPDVLVVDSVQTLEDPDQEQPAGSVTQVRSCAAGLVRYAKRTGACVLLVGHVTKDGNVAGPKVLEHVVDTVLTIEGERSGAFRLLRAMKNRFGSCEETGVFTMTEHGLEAVEDPSAMFLADRRPGVEGSIVFPGLEGTRPLLMELQSLVCDTSIPQPRRVSTGIDPRRLALLLGVMTQRVDNDFGKKDVFVAAAGGLSVSEPAADLPLCLSLCSAWSGRAMDPSVVAFGEIGLGGEVRRVPGSERRLTEAYRLGFRTALVPSGVDRCPKGMRIIEIGELRDAFATLRLKGRPSRSPAEADEGTPVVSLVSDRT
ncbi:MAG: DNA repair protein RadA [Actinomycetota bacterium]